MANPRNTRNGKGRYIRDPETAERDAEICRMRTTGMSLRAIATELGLHHSSVQEAYERALQAIIQEPAENARALELARLDAELQRLNKLETAAKKVLERQHVTVSHGRIIKDDTGEPILDDAPVLQAIDRLVRIEDSRRRNGERRAKLLGLDAPAKVDATVTEVTQQDIALQEMVAEIRARNAVTEQRLRVEREAGDG